MDLISRQAAQTELMTKCERYTLARESHGLGHVEWSSDLISVADAMDAIRDLPSAQPGQRWIPVTERLPEEDGCYLVTENNGEVVRYVFHVNESSREFWYRTVVAWMPQPEPWRGEEHEL